MYLVRNWYRHFPSLLNISKTNFEVGYSSKIRTKETAEAFVRALIALQIRNNQSSYDETNIQLEGLFERTKCFIFRFNLNYV